MNRLTFLRSSSYGLAMGFFSAVTACYPTIMRRADASGADERVDDASDAAPDIAPDAIIDVSTDSNADAPEGGADAANDATPTDAGALSCDRRLLGRSLLGGAARVRQLGMGSGFGCAIFGESGNVRCWGNRDDGQRGNGGGTDYGLGGPVLRQFNTPLEGVEELAFGTRHVCARNTSGSTYCWGNEAAITAWGTRSRYMAVVEQPMGTNLLTAGGGHTCALLSANATTVRCWGDNARHELGLPASSTATMNDVGPFEGGVQVCNVAAGSHFTCALLANGHVWCWGGNNDYQLGVADGVDHVTPVQVPLGTIDALAIRAGWDFACVIGNRPAVGSMPPVEQGLFCWGRNANQQLGTEAPSSLQRLERPSRVYGGGAAGPDMAIGDAVLADQTGCLMTRDTREIFCWGSNGNQLLGQQTSRGQGAASPAPIQIDLSAARLSSAFETLMIANSQAASICGIHAIEGTMGGEVVCWGANSYGQLARVGHTPPADGGATPPMAPGIATLLTP